MTDKYDWSESGLRLLSIIEDRILIYGGNDKCAYAMENEQIKGHRMAIKRNKPDESPAKWKQWEVDFIIANRHKTAIEVSSMITGRTPHAVSLKWVRLMAEGIIKKRKSKLQKRYLPNL